MKSKKNKISPLAQAMQDFVRAFADNEYFGTRKALNTESVAYLHEDKGFQEDLKAIRRRLKIPRLQHEYDVVSYDTDENNIEAFSQWLYSEGKEVQFDQEIEKLFVKYSLPKNFRDWLHWYILYRTKPPWTPFYNWDLLEQLVKDKGEAKRIPLTTKEKKLVKNAFRMVTKSKRGRPKREVAKAYKELIQVLDESKNTQRRSRTLKQGMKTLKKGKVEKYFDPVTEKTIVEKPTYKKLAVQMKENINDKARDRLAATLRKQNERIKKRKSRIIKVEK